MSKTRRVYTTKKGDDALGARLNIPVRKSDKERLAEQADAQDQSLAEYARALLIAGMSPKP